MYFCYATIQTGYRFLAIAEDDGQTALNLGQSQKYTVRNDIVSPANLIKTEKISQDDALNDILTELNSDKVNGYSKKSILTEVQKYAELANLTISDFDKTVWLGKLKEFKNSLNSKLGGLSEQVVQRTIVSRFGSDISKLLWRFVKNKFKGNYPDDFIAQMLDDSDFPEYLRTNLPGCFALMKEMLNNQKLIGAIVAIDF